MLIIQKIKQLLLLAGVLPLCAFGAFLFKVKIWQPKCGKAAMCSDRCDFEKEEFSIECYRLFGLDRTSTVWSPSHISSRLPLISPGASQTVPLMLWGPSFTHSIFDLSYFLQLKPGEVYSHRPTPCLSPVPPTPFLRCSQKWPPNWLRKICFVGHVIWSGSQS